MFKPPGMHKYGYELCRSRGCYFTMKLCVWGYCGICCPRDHDHVDATHVAPAPLAEDLKQTRSVDSRLPVHYAHGAPAITPISVSPSVPHVGSSTCDHSAPAQVALAEEEVQVPSLGKLEPGGGEMEWEGELKWPAYGKNADAVKDDLFTSMIRKPL